MFDYLNVLSLIMTISLLLLMTFRKFVPMFAQNLKFLRKSKKISQEALARELLITRAKYTSLENGQVKTPLIDDLIKIADFFLVTIDSLLKSDLTNHNLEKSEIDFDDYVKGKNLRILTVSVDKENNENVEYVPITAKSGYTDGYKDPDYIFSLPKLKIPNLPKGSTYRMFPTRGESMLPIPDGSDVIATYVDDWATIRSETPCIIILKGNQDFVFKKVNFINNKYLLLSSFNPDFEPFEVEMSDVLEIWQYYSFHSTKIPNHSIENEQILELLMAIKKEIKELNNNAHLCNKK